MHLKGSLSEGAVSRRLTEGVKKEEPTMSTNQTTNYQLSQWVKSDQVKMEDFNADNAKIDAALGQKVEQSAVAALAQTVEGHTSALARKGNCRIEYRSYVGTGQYGPDYPTVITFTRKPLFVIIAGSNQCVMDSPMLPRFIFLANDEKQNPYTHYSTWTDTQLSIYSNTASSPSGYYPDNALAQMNSKDVTFVAILFFAEDA